MIFDFDELAAAVILFDDNGNLLREILYSEFEAILENYVPAIEWAGKTLHATYVQIDSQYHIKSSVFFWLSFDMKGGIAKEWNLPLEQLAANSEYGADVGQGPVRMACLSQCPIKHFEHALWDPNLSKSKGHLAIIKKAIQFNRLSIEFKGPQQTDPSNMMVPTLGHAQSSELHQANDKAMAHIRQHTAQVLKEQRLKVAMLEKTHKNELKEVKSESSARLNEYREHVELLSGVLEEEKDRNLELKQIIEGQASKIEGLREYFEHKLAQREGQDDDDYVLMQENYRAEMDAKINVITSETKEQLNVKDIEILYLQEKNQQLQDEVERLREENKQSIANSGDHILNKMAIKGISFVAYQSGAGHITLPQSEISRYMNNPILYAAESCGVSQDHYLAWLQHYQAPACRHCDDQDTICGANLDRIEQPSEFRVSIDDRCATHRARPSLKLAGS